MNFHRPLLHSSSSCVGPSQSSVLASARTQLWPQRSSSSSKRSLRQGVDYSNCLRVALPTIPPNPATTRALLGCDRRQQLKGRAFLRNLSLHSERRQRRRGGTLCAMS
jgi:hypothetical protein